MSAVAVYIICHKQKSNHRSRIAWFLFFSSIMNSQEVRDLLLLTDSDSEENQMFDGDIDNDLTYIPEPGSDTSSEDESPRKKKELSRFKNLCFLHVGFSHTASFSLYSSN